MKRVLVTGATGTVGREVVRALVARGDVHVRVTTRGMASESSVETVRFDYDDPGTFEAAFRDVDAFFFVSPLVETQVESGLAELASARAAGVTKCVRLSSRATGWDEVSELRRWHRAIEQAIETSGMRFTMLRPCSFMQNVLGAPLALVRERAVLSMPLGSGAIPFVDARDLGEAAAICLSTASHEGETLVLTGAEALTGDDLARIVGEVRGEPVRYRPSSHEAAREAAHAHGVPDWLVESGLRVYARAESGEEREVDPALGRLLGRAPGSFRAFAERHRDLFTKG